VFDLPDLPKKRGGHVKVFKNLVTRNNLQNFAPKGNIVGEVPAGTGIMVLATNDVEIYENKIWDNKTVSTAIVSYFITERPIRDSVYNPYPSKIYIHDNIYSVGRRMPTWKNKLGFLFWLKFGRRVPHILFDGISKPEFLQPDGRLKPAYQICVNRNENGSFANLKADKKFHGISRDVRLFDCVYQN